MRPSLYKVVYSCLSVFCPCYHNYTVYMYITSGHRFIQTGTVLMNVVFTVVNLSAGILCPALPDPLNGTVMWTALTPVSANPSTQE